MSQELLEYSAARVPTSSAPRAVPAPLSLRTVGSRVKVQTNSISDLSLKPEVRHFIFWIPRQTPPAEPSGTNSRRSLRAGISRAPREPGPNTLENSASPLGVVGAEYSAAGPNETGLFQVLTFRWRYGSRYHIWIGPRSEPSVLALQVSLHLPKLISVPRASLLSLSRKPRRSDCNRTSPSFSMVSRR